MTPIAVRLPDDLLGEIDALVAAGWYPTRSACIKQALGELLATLERRRIDEAIREGYERVPQSDDEAAWSDASTDLLDEVLGDDPW
jgi:Arc/MetJ-type ribon-helix-helix transcriptional regulator